MIKHLIKKMFGIDKLEKTIETHKQEIEIIQQIKKRHENEAIEAEEKADLAKMSPKERATEREEAWVAVLDTHVNKDNIRNGFFELDWNKFFINELIAAGYGYEDDPEEEIVDRWFRDLAGNMLAEAGLDVSSRTGGFINVTKLADGKSQVE